jgi:hypothetical protein
MPLAPAIASSAPGWIEQTTVFFQRDHHRDRLRAACDHHGFSAVRDALQQSRSWHQCWRSLARSSVRGSRSRRCSMVDKEAPSLGRTSRRIVIKDNIDILTIRGNPLSSCTRYASPSTRASASPSSGDLAGISRLTNHNAKPMSTPPAACIQVSVVSRTKKDRITANSGARNR